MFDEANNEFVNASPPALETFSITTWIRKTTSSNWNAIVGKGNFNNDDRIYQLMSTGDGFSVEPNALRLQFHDTGGTKHAVDSSNGGDIPAGEWVHVAGTFNGTHMKVFMDGQEEGVNNVGAVTPRTSDSLSRIGVARTGSTAALTTSASTRTR